LLGNQLGDFAAAAAVLAFNRYYFNHVGPRSLRH
jgi:hypothetical protein